jgi:hypothetical protein
MVIGRISETGLSKSNRSLLGSKPILPIRETRRFFKIIIIIIIIVIIIIIIIIMAPQPFVGAWPLFTQFLDPIHNR